VLRNFGLALTRPGDFFAALARMRGSLLPPFLILLATVLVAGGLEMGGFLLGHGGPQLTEFRSLVHRAGVAPEALAGAMLVLSPLSALILWVEVWLPARIGTGPCPRLFELAGWSRLPQLLFAPVQGLAALFLSPTDAWAFLIVDLVPLCWSAVLLFNALRAFRPDRATRGATVYLVAFLGILFLEYLLRSSIGASGSPPAVL
jgi:hypothetical protein